MLAEIAASPTDADKPLLSNSSPMLLIALVFGIWIGLLWDFYRVSMVRDSYKTSIRFQLGFSGISIIFWGFLWDSYKTSMGVQ